MARLVGVNIPDNKRIVIALTYVFGIGLTTSKKILEKLAINENDRVKDVSEEKINEIRKELDSHVLEADLRRQISLDIKRLQEISCYRGMRHRLKLPVRGQTTKRNAKTRKGKSVAIANKKK